MSSRRARSRDDELGPDARAALERFDWQPRRGPAMRSLPEQLAERIAAEIYADRLGPGERIREQALGDRYEVSRGPVREALRLLERDGLVVILARRGAHVTRLSASELRDIFEIRAHLIHLAMERLARQADEQVLRDVRLAVAALSAIAAEDEGADAHADAYLDVSYRLTLCLAEGCGNARLSEIVGSLARQTRRYTRLGLATTALRRRSASGWRRAERHLRAGRIDEAAGEARSLVLRTREVAGAALEQMERRRVARAASAIN